LADLGVPETTTALGIRATDIQSGERVKARIAQINEILQVDVEQFDLLLTAGVQVGSEVEIENDIERVVLYTGTHEVELMYDLAHAIRVELL
jgi:DtxR family Mn-dependent transcriptional regulator